VDALRQKLAAMAKDPDVNPLERRKIEDQILELEKQYALKRISMKKDEVDRKKQLDQAFEQTLQSSFSSGIMGMLQGTETLAKAMKQIYAGLVQDVINMLAEMATQWIETHLLMKIFGIQTGKETAGSNIMASAASGAAAAGASVAAIPVIGWSMVQAVSDETYATLAAFQAGIAGFALGGIVPATGLALVHRGERILPASMSGTGAGIGGGHTFNFHYHISGLDGADITDTYKSKLRPMMRRDLLNILKKAGGS
jgi:hypothetical protein